MPRSGIILPVLNSKTICLWPILAIAFIAIFPGFCSAIVVLIFGEKFSFSYPEVQNISIATTVLISNIVSLLGIAFGVILAFPASRSSNDTHALPKPYESRIRLYIYLFLAIIFGTLALFSFEGNVFTNSYSRGASPLFGIGIYSVFAVFSLAGALMVHLSAATKKVDIASTLVVAVYVLIWCLLLRGSRLDLAGFLFAAFMMVWINGRLLRRVILISAAAVLILFLWRWGSYRAMLACESKNLLEILLSNPLHFACNPVEGSTNQTQAAALSNWPGYFSNIGDIALSQYQVIWAIGSNIIDFQNGKNYIDYLIRLLPSILFPGRPVDFSIDGIRLGGGSLHFLSEAYVNFGLFGSFFVSLCVGFFVQLATNLFAKNRSYYSGLFLILLLSLTFRGLWYQFFGVFKSISYWAIVELVLFWIIAWTSRILPRSNTNGTHR